MQHFINNVAMRGKKIISANCNAEDTHKGTISIYQEKCLLETHHRETFRLLREFDDKVFLAAHDAKLLQEDGRLEDLDQKTLLCSSMKKMFLVKYKGSVDYNIYIHKVSGTSKVITVS